MASLSGKKKMLLVCETCPWRIANHGKKHKAGWYKLSNLKRLWNGFRKGEAPGMICHSTDPENVDYGGDKKVTPGHTSECAGALLLLMKHMNEFGKCATLKEYQSRHPLPLTKHGAASMVERFLSGNLPEVADQSDQVGLPWDPNQPL